jgi:branched-chain amino acid transport system permease protein
MSSKNTQVSTKTGRFRRTYRWLAAPFGKTPALGWLLAGLVVALLEMFAGRTLAHMLGLSKIPALFGSLVIFTKPSLHFPFIFNDLSVILSVFIYDLLIYVIPLLLVAWLTAGIANKLSGMVYKRSVLISVLIHLLLLYLVLRLWTDVSTYRELVTRLTMIAVIVTLSLNVINGYMGEFSASHPGFMAVGAYVASVFTIAMFTDSNLFGAAKLPASWAPFLFPIGLILGGAVAAVSALIVAIPSFRTRGDYLAIISLAFMFIIKSFFENLEMVGGPRGLGGQPDLASFPVIFVWMALGIWIINNFVRSTLGKALNAVRDDELAADAMTVNTRRTKMIAFLFGAFWAGLAGGLLAHVLRYINPGSFGLQKLAEVLAMVYFGGLNSVLGSIVGAVSMNLLSEALRPLELYKWIVIPVILILVMIYRPTGLIAFREFDLGNIVKPKNMKEGDDATS